MLKLITYNCHGLYSNIQNIIDICDWYDLIFLQEIWLFKYDLSILCNVHPLFEGFGCSAIDESNGIIQGRCYCRAVIDLICLILSVIDCVMTSRLIHTSQTTIFRHRTVFIFNRMLM